MKKIHKSQKWEPIEAEIVSQRAKDDNKTFSRVVIESTMNHLGYKIPKSRNWLGGRKLNTLSKKDTINSTKEACSPWYRGDRQADFGKGGAG